MLPLADVWVKYYLIYVTFLPLQALEKKAKAEKLLVELEQAEIPQQSEIDKEGITQEERYMLRKVGLRMKPFLLLGELDLIVHTFDLEIVDPIIYTGANLKGTFKWCPPITLSNSCRSTS